MYMAAGAGPPTAGQGMALLAHLVSGLSLCATHLRPAGKAPKCVPTAVKLYLKQYTNSNMGDCTSSSVV